MIVRFVGRGTFVSGGSNPGLQALLTRLETASPTDVMEVRIIIEPQAAALAAHRANSEDLRGLDEILRNSICAKGIAAFEHWDAQLHLAISRAAKNALLLDYCQAINSVRNQPHWYRLKQKSLNGALRITYDTQHSKIVKALKERDGEAAKRALYEHLITVRDRMLQTEL
jgi:DNA-binding FadR family transcriptional regulator